MDGATRGQYRGANKCRCGEDMDSRAQDSTPEQEVQADHMNEGMPESEERTEGLSETEGEHTEGEHSSKKRPSGWERLKQKNRTLEREIHDLRATVGDMQTRMEPQSQDQSMNPYGSQPQSGGNVDEQIHRAVSYALQAKEAEERKAHMAAQAMHVQKQYEGLHDHLDRVSDKYDDFDDVVRGHDVPITSHMRDASLFLPQEGPGSAGEVLYKLAKNKPELERISKLHPLEQARELNKLSRSLEIGGNKGTIPPQRTLGNIKNNPVSNSQVISDKTPVSDLRAKMKAGGKRWY